MQMSLFTFEGNGYVSTLSNGPDLEHGAPALAADADLELIPDLPDAACATTPVAEEWVPTAEQRLVPAELTAICRACPVRQACLDWAMAHRPTGYWAATTSDDRQHMLAHGQHTTAHADDRQDAIFDRIYPLPNHDDPPSRKHYVHDGCRCYECRLEASGYRAERARRRQARSDSDPHAGAA